MRYLSFCSGVEAASLAWMPLGWEAVAFSEIETFPCAVLKERFPDVPNLGDCTKIHYDKNTEELYVSGADGIVSRRINAGRIDLCVGGFPCQSFSVAGKRTGLKGTSGLILEYFRLLKEIEPQWFVYENVPECYLPKKEEILELSSMDFGNAGIMSHGECWTLNTCEWTDTLVPFLREDGVCSLSDILETGDIPLKYYLSRDACTGMLRRAERRGKKLPAVLEEALRRQAFAQ